MGTMGVGLGVMHGQRFALPQVKLKSTGDEPAEPKKRFEFGSTSASVFQNMRKQMTDRITSKSNLHAHLKHNLGRPGGSRFGTLDP